MSKGTPRSLEQAIDNALEDPVFSDYRAGRAKEIKVIYDHVRDFLSQKFMASMLNNDDCEHILRELFEKCVKRKS